ncbi:MAG: DNA/RNA helicase domain-containing protein [Candidatus Marinimicrobia bacterium]|nr:DNA/RNA helicase domain-containing protein [Candidatus Neomarinimicrobiota bacterium]
MNDKSGLYRNKGENQIKEIINAAACSIFFIDEDQRIHMQDIGTKKRS